MRSLTCWVDCPRLLHARMHVSTKETRQYLTWDKECEETTVDEVTSKIFQAVDRDDGDESRGRSRDRKGKKSKKDHKDRKSKKKKQKKRSSSSISSSRSSSDSSKSSSSSSTTQAPHLTQVELN